MLRDIRKASANWLGKAIMGTVVAVLALSFAIWGVGDIFRGFGRSTVASVGSTEISVEQFRQIYNERLQQIAAQFGRPVPADQARALGLDRQILGQVLADAALDERARQLGLGITDDEVARQIKEMPVFRGAGGQFDHDLFVQRLRSAGYTEPRFVSERRRLMVRQQLTDSVSTLAEAPKAVIDAANRFQNERRSAEYVTLGRAQAGDIPEPTPEQITAYFDTRKELFRLPEYRRLSIVKLTPDDIAKWITVSDDEAKTLYDERRARFVTPGRRQVQQIIFPSEEEAKAVKERIDGGATFEDIAKARGMSEKDIDLGFVTRAALAPAVAEAAFSLPEGGVSGPVASRIGTALVRVVKIEPDKTKTFEEAAPAIKQELAREKTRTEANEKHDKIEDERAAGQTLAEAAQKAGLTATVIDAVDRQGRDPAGAPVADLPPGIDVLTPAFATDVGVETDPLRVGPEGYIWFEVTNITPSRERTLEEAKAQVEQHWRDDQVATRLAAKATELVDKLKSGTSLADIAAGLEAKVETASDIKRGTASPGLPVPAVAAIYATPKDGAGSTVGQTQAERVIFRVTGISIPAADAASPDGKRLDEALRTSISEDLLRQYVAEVERELGATINADALRRVSGGETSDSP